MILTEGVEANLPKRRLKVWDGRSLLAGIALLMTGAITAEIVDQYVYQQITGSLLTRSRLWWEIVLNLQILSVGMIWFCYSDRIADASGNLKRMQVFICTVTILAALMPSFLAGVSAANNWFSVRPSMQSFIGFFLFALVFWLMSLVAQAFLLRVRARMSGRIVARRPLWYYSPVLMLVAICAVDAPLGGRAWLVATPALLYLQGAMPYFVHAFRQPKEADAPPPVR